MPPLLMRARGCIATWLANDAGQPGCPRAIPSYMGSAGRSTTAEATPMVKAVADKAQLCPANFSLRPPRYALSTGAIHVLLVSNPSSAVNSSSTASCSGVML